MTHREALAEIDRLAKITDEMCDTIHGLEARAEAAEAKLARVLEMLEPSGTLKTEAQGDYQASFELGVVRNLHTRVVAIAEGST